MKPGQELAGRYRLERQLGEGGWGQVWQALDLRLSRRVAVKALISRTGRPTDEMLDLFRREGKAAARFNHPHIATLHDADVDDGRPFLVLELLAGPNLAALLHDQPQGLPIATVLEYGVQAAEGLAAAHAAEVIHRDIKPSNLMLDGNGTLKICDFGIARLQDATAMLATIGPGIGTPAYMPPEQWLGEPVTGAGDVYALGVTLFQLLTGRTLFPADGIRAIMGQHLNNTPPPASSLRAGIPQALDTYLLTLLAKDPASRPPAHAVAERLCGLDSWPTRAGQLATLRKTRQEHPNGDTRNTTAAREAIITGLAEIVNETVNIPIEDVQLDRSFERDLGIDSLTMIEIVVAAEEHFDVSIPDDDVKKLKTIRDATDYILKAPASRSGPRRRAGRPRRR